MPDLIIKPTNTSGNKVIIQDQGGNAVLTTSDSGVTISNVTISESTGDLVTKTTAKVKQKGAFMQSSTHQSLVLGGQYGTAKWNRIRDS